MRTYELMTITRGNLDETTVQNTVDRFTTLIANRGGTVTGVDHWGKRQFAYEINHMWEGFYTVVDFDAPTEAVAELDRQLRITDEIVRHKIIRPAARTKRVS